MFCVIVHNNYKHSNSRITFKAYSTLVNWKTKGRLNANILQSFAAFCGSCLVLKGDKNNRTIFRDQLVPCLQGSVIETINQHAE